MTINAYPLSWPTGWKRTEPARQREAKFSKYDKRLTLTQGLERVLAELERMGIDKQDVIVSTNVRTRLDGMPRSGEPEPADHGAAVYWQECDGARRVMAIDLYDKVADNLAAIAATLGAMRAIERHGGAAILERAFTGFTALPAPTAARDWWDVLGVHRTTTGPEQIKAVYRVLASRLHPDKGGSAEKMAELNQARDAALKECGG